MDLAYDLAHVQTLRQVLSQDLRLVFQELVLVQKLIYPIVPKQDSHQKPLRFHYQAQ